MEILGAKCFLKSCRQKTKYRYAESITFRCIKRTHKHWNWAFKNLSKYDPNGTGTKFENSSYSLAHTSSNMHPLKHWHSPTNSPRAADKCQRKQLIEFPGTSDAEADDNAGRDRTALTGAFYFYMYVYMCVCTYIRSIKYPTLICRYLWEWNVDEWTLRKS